MEGFILFLLVTSFGFSQGKTIKPKKVAILGGGAASCSAALALTGQPGWKERYDVTIYQLGWRLGGKAASGRNKDYGQRVEEVAGHHFPSTFIETKRLLRSVYDELDRPEEAPIRTFEEAFRSKSVWTGLDMDCEIDPKCFSMDSLFEQLIGTVNRMTDKMIKELKIDYTINKKHLKPDSTHLKFEVASIQALLKNMFPVVKSNSPRQEVLSIIDTAAAVIIGFIEDNLLQSGFHRINDLDLRQWLKKHGASETTLDSRFVLVHYDESISYINGDRHRPNMEAGTALLLFLPFYFCCEETVKWEQEVGLGDAVFAPIYEILKERGVRFKFFHKIEELNLSNANSNIVEQIRMTKQVNLVGEEYHPLIEVKGLPSWPNEPKYDNIEHQQAYLLKEHHIDLENFWTDWS